jgi:hypothetical protein
MIGKALRAAATEQGLTLTEIGARIGRSQDSLRHYWQERAIPPGDILIRLMLEVPGFAEHLGFKHIDADSDQAA